MRKTSLFLLFSLLFLSVSCGPIIGQLTRLGDGFKTFEVESGTLDGVKKGSRILVVGPFSVSGSGYHIARGDDSAFFYREFVRNGYLAPELYVGDKNSDPEELKSSLRSLRPDELKTKLGLENAPDLILFGDITERSTFVAPTRGILQRVGYRLEIVNAADGSSTVINAVVRARFRDCPGLIVDELIRRIRRD